MVRQYSLPLFPLNAVLFPGMPLPLHIFEDRYLQLVTECLERREPFGVVLIKEGAEVGETAVPYSIGTSAIITETAMRDDGRMDIHTIGYQRFRVLTLSYDRPFLSGLVESYPPLDEETDEAYLQTERLRPHLEQYLQLLGDLTEAEVKLDPIPEKPILIAYLTAVLLQVPLSDKQDLLAAVTIPEMLALETKLLLREQRLLKANIGAEFRLETEKILFSPS
jgi:Lon protease-like protein